jgi:predicted KAP-like P-loop ATPase
MAKEVQEKLTFEEHDQFDRVNYANFLIELAQHAESKEGSYTIAVNAPYGSGKTTLLKMMSSKIKAEYSTIQKPLVVVYYNAWQYDFFNEPLVPLTMALFEDEALAEELDYKRFIGRLACVSRFVASLANDVIVRSTGLNIKEACKATKTKGKEDDFFEYKNAIEELRDALKDAIDLYGDAGRMIVIIDELDRCKPDFAIKTLEITKHLLTNEKIIFLYALDMGQLQKAVEKAYGSGMDSAGYLLRFFDYISTIPEPNLHDYLIRKIQDIEKLQYLERVTEELGRVDTN